MRNLGKSDENDAKEGEEEGTAEPEVVANAANLFEGENSPQRTDDTRTRADDGEGGGETQVGVGNEATTLSNTPGSTSDHGSEEELGIDERIIFLVDGIADHEGSGGEPDTNVVGESELERVGSGVLILQELDGDHVGAVQNTSDDGETETEELLLSHEGRRSRSRSSGARNLTDTLFEIRAGVDDRFETIVTGIAVDALVGSLILLL